MLIVNVLYDADTRLMKITSISSMGTAIDTNAVATTGDNLSTVLVFEITDPQGTLDGFSARAEFGVNVIGTDGTTYHPYLPLEEDYVILPNSILSAVKCGKLPFQLVFSRMVDGEKVTITSLNTIALAVNRAIDALQTPSDVNPRFADAIYDVQYDESTATFTFTQMDGNEIAIALTDLSEEHFEVPTYDDLVTLSEAQNGDTATALDTGVWYKLYGSYDNLDDWYEMSGKSATGHRFMLDFTDEDAMEVLLYEVNNGEYTSYLDMNDTNVSCTFYDESGYRIVLPYQIAVAKINNGEIYYKAIVTCMIPETVIMEISAVPSNALDSPVIEVL